MTNNKTPLLEVIRDNIKELYSEEAANAFMCNKELRNYTKYTDSVQRGLANRVLISKLLIFRATSKVKVVDAIYCLIPDGDNEAWMNIFKIVIIPFLKENKIKL